MFMFAHLRRGTIAILGRSTSRAMSSARADEAALRHYLRGDHSLHAIRTAEIEGKPAVMHLTEKNYRVVVLNRPKALNALSLDMVRYMTPRYFEWAVAKESPITVLAGSGKAFCAGGDIVQIVQAKQPGKDMSITDAFFREEYQLNFCIGSFKRPHVAFLDGFTMGGGVGLSVHGAFRVATENTVFAMPETGIGFFPDVGGSYFLPRLPGELGMFLGLTGYRLTGLDALYARVATHYVPAANLQKILDNFKDLSTADHEHVSAAINAASPDIPQVGQAPLAQHRECIDACFSANSVEEIYSRLQEDGSAFAMKQLESLKKMSPLSLKITFEQLRRGKSLSLEECLGMEFRMSQRFVQGHDFSEGVHALLIDKPRRPAKWQHATVQDVKPDEVSAYFQPLEPSKELKLKHVVEK